MTEKHFNWTLLRNVCWRQVLTVGRAIFEAWRPGLAVVPHIKVNNMTLVLELAIAGAGIAVVDCDMAAPALAAGQIIEVLPSLPRPLVPIYLVFPSKTVPRRVDELVGRIYANL